MFGRSDRLRNLADELTRRDTKPYATNLAIQSSDYYDGQEKDNTSASETSKSHYGGADLHAATVYNSRRRHHHHV